MNIVVQLILLISCLFNLNYAIYKAKFNRDDESSDSFRQFNDYRAQMQMQQFTAHTVKIFSRENTKTLSGYSCSASIIHPLFVITSAHCVHGLTIIDVFIGRKISIESNIECGILILLFYFILCSKCR
jgi:secreted trypsin-like serine protease